MCWSRAAPQRHTHGCPPFFYHVPAPHAVGHLVRETRMTTLNLRRGRRIGPSISRTRASDEYVWYRWCGASGQTQEKKKKRFGVGHDDALGNSARTDVAAVILATPTLCTASQAMACLGRAASGESLADSLSDAEAIVEMPRIRVWARWAVTPGAQSHPPVLLGRWAGYSEFPPVVQTFSSGAPHDAAGQPRSWTDHLCATNWPYGGPVTYHTRSRIGRPRGTGARPPELVIAMDIRSS